MPKVKGRKKPGRPLSSRNKIKKSKAFKKELTEGEDQLANLKSSAKTHFTLETKVTISCKECNKKFKFKKNYLKHIKEEHSKLKNCYKCTECSVQCPSKEILQKHKARKHESKYYCKYCNKEFARYAHVLRHIAQTGCDGFGVNSYPCETCGAVFKRKDNLMVHLRAQHIIKKQFQCKKNCVFTTRNFNKLIIHDQKSHSGKFSLECDDCGKLAGSRAAMIKHLEIHGEKKYFCDVCGYQTHTVEVMRRHVFTHVKEKPHRCGYCDRSFIQHSQLQKHLERHEPTQVICFLCGLQFESQKLLDTHKLKKHLTNRNRTCPVEKCKYKDIELPSEEAFEAHIKEHYGQGCYPCDICSKSFMSEPSLRQHMGTHTLERARRCMYCVRARAFARGMQLVKHVRQVHPTVFAQHLAHVRKVIGGQISVTRVKNSEMEAILMVLDVEAERILQGYGEGVLYGGMLEITAPPDLDLDLDHLNRTTEESPLMSEEELADNLNMLLSQLIDKETLECFGWPDEPVDTILEKVIEQCGARVADKEKWNRVQCLRENAKHLFLYVVEDKNIARMLDTHTIDQIVKHILAQVSQDTDNENNVKSSIIPTNQY